MPLSAFAPNGGFMESLSRVSNAGLPHANPVFFSEGNIMLRAFLLAATILGSGVWVSCADDAHTPAKPAPHPGMVQLKKLVGTWVQADEKGNPTSTVVSVFKTTGGGSAIHETIFPGTEHEMVTVYHPEGKDLVLTHYCAIGNQPKMKLDPKSPANVLHFVFVGGSNIDPAKDAHMHEGKIVIVDEDHIDWIWLSHRNGKLDTSHQVEMKLIRKKS